MKRIVGAIVALSLSFLLFSTAFADSTVETSYERAGDSTNFADPEGFKRFERQLGGGDAPGGESAAAEGAATSPGDSGGDSGGNGDGCGPR